MTHKGEENWRREQGRLRWWWMQLVHGSAQSTEFWARQTHIHTRTQSQLRKEKNRKEERLKRETGPDSSIQQPGRFDWRHRSPFSLLLFFFCSFYFGCHPFHLLPGTMFVMKYEQLLCVCVLPSLWLPSLLVDGSQGEENWATAESMAWRIREKKFYFGGALNPMETHLLK